MPCPTRSTRVGRSSYAAKELVEELDGALRSDRAMPRSTSSLEKRRRRRRRKRKRNRRC
jgi:hypothetical protein